MSTKVGTQVGTEVRTAVRTKGGLQKKPGKAQSAQTKGKSAVKAARPQAGGVQPPSQVERRSRIKEQAGQAMASLAKTKPTAKISQMDEARQESTDAFELRAGDASAGVAENLPNELNSLVGVNSGSAQPELQNKTTSNEHRSAPHAAVAANQEWARQDRAARQTERQEAKEARQNAKVNLGERYHQAAASVGLLRKEFLDLLDEKARLLGVERVGEAVPMHSAEMESVDAEIRETRKKLEELAARKKRLKGSSPEMDALNRRINDIRQQREEARTEKKAAYIEATSGKTTT